jgi:hypothetical protein
MGLGGVYGFNLLRALLSGGAGERDELEQMRLMDAVEGGVDQRADMATMAALEQFLGDRAQGMSGLDNPMLGTMRPRPTMTPDLKALVSQYDLQRIEGMRARQQMTLAQALAEEGIY